MAAGASSTVSMLIMKAFGGPTPLPSCVDNGAPIADLYSMLHAPPATPKATLQDLQAVSAQPNRVLSLGLPTETRAQYVIAVFMLIFGVNFTLFYFILIGKGKEVLKNTEFKVFIGIVIVAVTAICVNVLSMYNTIEEAFRKSLFQVASIISTTGFSTTNFDNWPALSKMILFFLMIFGACAGSTAGGLKLSRVIILVKSGLRKIKLSIYPRNVETIHMDKKPISDEQITLQF